MNVLDASTVLAVINDEAGAGEALTFFDRAVISSVNLAEVLQKATQLGLEAQHALTVFGELNIGTVPFDNSQAVTTAGLWPLTRQSGLSLADRACLALASSLGGIAVTADRAWGTLDIPGIDIHVISR